VSFRHVRFQQQRLLKTEPGLLPLAETLQRQSCLVVRLGMTGFSIGFRSRNVRCHFNS
jgi:hypothetical protein